MANTKDYAIATLGSHSALQIMKGAKDEGMHAICICQKGKSQPYESYGVADEIIEVDDFNEGFFAIEDQLIAKNAIIVPHGSFVSYIGPQRMKDVRVMHYGDKGILEWESNRTKEREWLLSAGLKMPKIFKSGEEIDKPVIVKFHGAKGGFGYFIAKSPEEFYEKMKQHPEEKDYAIQEYIVGVPIYTHYFYSNLTGEMEVMSFDKRYESNADSIGRIAAKDQIDAGIETSYTITGNIPVVIRESLLPQIFEMGENVVKEAKKLVPKGLYGPFCLEAILDPKLNFYVFEISARIVAGTNPFTNGSPYTWLRYDVPMSTGRRIAREIKTAIECGRLEEILG
ncbi:5-formaminoimidazole-4-carboxamide-1-(beta)-D-ribofuranosyl 5'-monophosphate synthetase [Candidatus Peregrinibacteria bacterium CG2_30_44_17]|nr:MAG: 5-formaminoimidazole-4-carboxamide-1-(beta)-D-ribofuranosyl 5'-monophosphate synthetase [Candidatus Peregrinibacteria bacterium CG2_30_44_17]